MAGNQVTKGAETRVIGLSGRNYRLNVGADPIRVVPPDLTIEGYSERTSLTLYNSGTGVAGLFFIGQDPDNAMPIQIGQYMTLDIAHSADIFAIAKENPTILVCMELV